MIAPRVTRTTRCPGGRSAQEDLKDYTCVKNGIRSLTYLVCFLIKTIPETSQVVDTIEEPSDKRNAIVHLANVLTIRVVTI